MTIQNDIAVHKFGGTSLADADRFKNVKSLLSGKNEVIIVSAIKDTTSTLQQLLDEAALGRLSKDAFTQLEQKHSKIIYDIVPTQNQEQLLAIIKHDIASIYAILDTVQKTTTYSVAVQEFVLGYGEQWSAQIMMAYLNQFKHVIYIDATQCLFIYYQHNRLCVDWEKSQQALDNLLRNQSFDQIVVTGYIASTREGVKTTLGRNGSDFSAAIFAKLFKSKALYIWTDVDGIYTADPTRVRSALVIESLTYQEALELAYFGAKVLHPMTIAPAYECQIPIYIKNSLNPQARGTVISAHNLASKYLIKGLTYVNNTTLINIEGRGVLNISGLAGRVFNLMHAMNVRVDLISQASSEHSICFAISNQNAALVVQALTDHFQLEINQHAVEKISAESGCAILAVVGEDMRGKVGVLGKLCSTLAKANINIKAISQGSSERNISVVINEADVSRALQVVHSGFYLSDKLLTVGLIGPGAIGGEFLRQLAAAVDDIRDKYQVNICVRGIMRKNKMLLQYDHIDLQQWPSLLEKDGVDANLDKFVEFIISEDVPHAVIIDCTASEMIAKQYIKFIEKNIHVITPNKYTNAGDFAYYKKLKSSAVAHNCRYLYEATVCAGLPVINTLHDIVASNDTVISIEGVVSGTLSYIFSELAKGHSFSQAVRQAKDYGYTETDPREDLSGMDVARKMVCLAREVGYEVTLDDVNVYDLVPKALKQCSIDEFMDKLPAYDNQIESLIQKANLNGEKLNYVGRIAEGKVIVNIASYPADHPLSRLQGADNMLIFHTGRYDALPLIIQGPGAGAAVTAAGIFADLLRLIMFIS